MNSRLVNFDKELLSYLLRNVTIYPVSASNLCKMAEDKSFPKPFMSLLRAFDPLCSFNTKDEVLVQFDYIQFLSKEKQLQSPEVKVFSAI